MRRGESAIFDCSGYGVALPLALRHAAGIADPPREPGETGAATCSVCSVRYFARPAGSHLPEDGRCRGCATESAPAKVLPLRRKRAQR